MKKKFNPYKNKFMKKTFLILACVFTLVSHVNADNYQPIDRNQLPQKAQTFLSTYFPESKISLTRKELDVIELNYDVIFADGSKIEFDRKGNWIEVDCINHPLPKGIVPNTIQKWIESQYPNAEIVKIEIDHREYEIKLNNRVELTFNKKYQLIDID